MKIIVLTVDKHWSGVTKMSKYKELLNVLQDNHETLTTIIDNWHDYERTILELIKKAIPMQPDKIIDDFCDDTYEYYFCPKCENEVGDTYCPSCGQALKWKD